MRKNFRQITAAPEQEANRIRTAAQKETAQVMYLKVIYPRPTEKATAFCDVFESNLSSMIPNKGLTTGRFGGQPRCRFCGLKLQGNHNDHYAALQSHI